MNIKQWLSNVYYDEYGTHIWNKEDADGGSQLVADVRGWGRIQNEFKTETEAADFQDEVGRFITEAIIEKIKRDFMSKKQTAVEWLHQIAKQREVDKFDWEQAKAMEKEEIMNSWASGVISDDNMTAEQYYNKTYN